MIIYVPSRHEIHFPDMDQESEWVQIPKSPI